MGGGRDRKENEKPKSIRKGSEMALDKLVEEMICRRKVEIINSKGFL